MNIPHAPRPAAKSNSAKLPDGRNGGQKEFLSIPQNYKPAPGSPKPTQASPGARGLIK